MILGVICFGVIGVFIAFLFVLLMINFDYKYKIIIQALLGLGGNGISLWGLFKLFSVSGINMKFAFTISFFTSFLFSLVIILIVMCYLIKDKDDNDILRIRDILLGQKSYIQKYYQQRENEIKVRLNIPMLEAREKAILIKEDSLNSKRIFLEEEEKRINGLGKSKLRISLPENKKVTLTEKFISVLPSYIVDYSMCVNEIRNTIEKMIEETKNNNTYTYQNLSTYFMNIIMVISNYLFGRSSDIRIHFRKYNDNTKKYEKLVAIEGNRISKKSLTPIPFEGSMIEKSYICKRAMIKSINSDYDFKSNNNRKWKDYMTYTFYNILRADKPILSFGISVKNEERFKDMFYFLSYVEVDSFLNEIVENINEEINIERIF